MAARLSSSRPIAAAAAAANAKFSSSLIRHHFFSSPKRIVAAAAAATTQSSVSWIHHRYPRPTAAVAKFSSSLIHHRFQSSDYWIHRRYPRPTVAVAQFSSLIHHRPPRPKPTVAAASAAAQSSSSSLIHSSAPVGSLRSRLASSRPLYGLISLASERFTPAYFIWLRGLLLTCDYVILDLWQGYGQRAFSRLEETFNFFVWAKVPVILRLPELSRDWANQALDFAPEGVMFPNIESADDAKMAVSYASMVGDEEMPVVVCEVESAAGLDNIEVVAGVEGVGIVHLGPISFSASTSKELDVGLMEKLMQAEISFSASTSKELDVGLMEKLMQAEERMKNPYIYMSGMVTRRDCSRQLARRGYDMVGRHLDPDEIEL